MLKLYFATFLFLLAATDAHGQTQTRVAVQIVDESEDDVGSRLIFRIKEEFRASSAFRLTDVDEARLKVIVSTMDRFKGDLQRQSIATVYSIIWLVEDEKTAATYLDNTIGFSGESTIASAAQTIIARTDRLVTILRRSAQ
jgi:hypothetical protein